MSSASTSPVHPEPIVHAADRTEGDVQHVYFVSFGCQMNVLDSELVLGDFARSGYRRTDEMKHADVVLINTCSIREHAEDKVWSLLGRARQVKEHRPNMTGTEAAYLPPGHTLAGGQRAATTSDYEAWKPE